MQYVYQKDRRDFGRQCLFTDKSELLFSEPPNRALFKDYILKNPVERWTQKTGQMSASEANTDRATFEHKGVNHAEGGWPKDINLADPEQVVRYRRKIEKDESYIVQVMNLTRTNSGGGGWMNAGVQFNGDRDLQGLEDETEWNGVKWDRVTVSFRFVWKVVQNIERVVGVDVEKR